MHVFDQTQQMTAANGSFPLRASSSLAFGRYQTMRPTVGVIAIFVSFTSREFTARVW